MKDYLWNVVLSGNRFINSLTGGNAEHTICTRVYRSHMYTKSSIAKVCVFVFDILFLWYEKDHCYASWMREKKRKY